MSQNRSAYAKDSAIERILFKDTRLAWLWLIVRLYVGYEWIEAGYHKVTAAGWMVTGESLKGFWAKAVAIPASGSAPITYDWYRAFLNGLLSSGSYVWFGKLIAVGEVAIGLGLILGAFVGIAAFFGAFMNLNFMLAGSASTNPVLFLLAILILLAYRTAGYWGADRILQPMIRKVLSGIISSLGGNNPEPAGA